MAMPGAAENGLASVPILGQTAILACVNAFFDVAMFDGESGPNTRLARCFMVGHFVSLDRLGAGGPLIGESDGRLSRQYAMPATKSEWLSTSYGRAAWMLASPRARAPGVL